MNDFATFLALAYENLSDLDGLEDLEGLDEVMYQTGVVLALAHAEAEASARTPGDDDGGATDRRTVAVAFPPTPSSTAAAAGACRSGGLSPGGHEHSGRGDARDDMFEVEHVELRPQNVGPEREHLADGPAKLRGGGVVALGSK